MTENNNISNQNNNQPSWKKIEGKDSFTLILFEKDGTGYGYV
jgi:hypothetical protein